ncbi:hypothetical protein D0Z07_2087 [Hyphodiscus hymeniophilus]|uniref:DUF7492 domain-containing protein n=1 Tax=Hyphodiscus hymeniophilus TaxID=353542 RepID=A0A9P6VQC2_9HELO|nr:hypothetical protein D0Z07_2087 [Hyphodiscus hymeniophilus]
MKYRYTLSSGLSVFSLLACTTTIQAHTWLEQLSVIAPNGTFVGAPGYPRGLVDRTAGVDPDAGNVYLLPPDGRATGNAILATDLMCKSTQMIGVQTPGNPSLVASPGNRVAMRYGENGHVTQPQIPVGKPEGSGTVFVYGTEKASNSDTYLGIHRVWNEAGTGGDARGALLATRYFDDGQCYQINNSPISIARQAKFPHTPDTLGGKDLYCQTDVQIPTTATGNYTLYWVWEWPTLDNTGKVATNQSYTSCMDIVLTPSSNSKAESVNFFFGQDLNHAAVADQVSNQFLVNPTASPQSFASGSPTPTFVGSVASSRATSPASPSDSASSRSMSTVSQSSSVAGGFVTVTVTATVGAETETITITETANGGASSSALNRGSPSTPAPTATYSPAPTQSLAASLGAAAAPQTSGSSVPPLVPFLSPASDVVSAPIQAYTLGARHEFKVRGRVIRP